MSLSVDVGKKILRDTFNRTVFRVAGEAGIFLVGGYIRDVLLDRPSRDRDYVVQGPVAEVTSRVAAETGGKAVNIGKKGLFRIVLEKGGTLDFSALREDLITDLSLRDFTVNAIAWGAETGLVDPFGGVVDLGDRLLRMVAAGNIESDPVRILRAYRLAHDLDFAVDEDTRASLKSCGHLLAWAKTERITLEFFRLLNSDDTATALRAMHRDGILEYIISRSFNALAERLDVVSRISKTFEKLPSQYFLMSDREFSQGLTWKGLLRLEALLTGLPENRLSIGNRIARRLEGVERAAAVAGMRPCRDRSVLYDLFEAAGESSQDYLILAEKTGLLEEYGRFNSVWRSGLVSSEEVRELSGIPGGKLLGEMIRRERKAEFLGVVSSREGALRFVTDCKISDRNLT